MSFLVDNNNKRQVNNFKNALSQIYFPLTKKEFDDICALKSADDVKKVYGANSREHINRKAINELRKRSGGILAADYKAYCDIKPETIAALGCTKVENQSSYESQVLDTLRPFDFSKVNRKYLQKNGTWGKKKDGIIKSIDAIRADGSCCVYHKQWKDQGGTQDSDTNELGELLTRISRTDLFLIIICTGNHFTSNIIAEINDLIESKAPDQAVVFTDQDNFSALLEFLTECYERKKVA